MFFSRYSSVYHGPPRSSPLYLNPFGFKYFSLFVSFVIRDVPSAFLFQRILQLSSSAYFHVLKRVPSSHLFASNAFPLPSFFFCIGRSRVSFPGTTRLKGFRPTFSHRNRWLQIQVPHSKGVALHASMFRDFFFVVGPTLLFSYNHSPLVRQCYGNSNPLLLSVIRINRQKLACISTIFSKIHVRPTMMTVREPRSSVSIQYRVEYLGDGGRTRTSLKLPIRNAS